MGYGTRDCFIPHIGNFSKLIKFISQEANSTVFGSKLFFDDQKFLLQTWQPD